MKIAYLLIHIFVHYRALNYSFVLFCYLLYSDCRYILLRNYKRIINYWNYFCVLLSNIKYYFVYYLIFVFAKYSMWKINCFEINIYVCFLFLYFRLRFWWCRWKLRGHGLCNGCLVIHYAVSWHFSEYLDCIFPVSYWFVSALIGV